MARMHARKKGTSGSTHPPAKAVPEWVSLDKKKIEAIVVSLAKEGKTASMIGKILRDEHGVPTVKSVCGKSVSEILKENKLAPDYPEDMLALIKKAVFLRKHVDRNKKDLHNRRGLELIEAKIKRLQRYYKRKKVLPANWFYKPETAALLVK